MPKVWIGVCDNRPCYAWFHVDILGPNTHFNPMVQLKPLLLTYSQPIWPYAPLFTTFSREQQETWHDMKVKIPQQARLLSWICILQDKIHQVINSICNINKRQTNRLFKTHRNKGNPSTSHTLNPSNERERLSRENHPDPDSPELKGDPPPPAEPSSICASLITRKGNNPLLPLGQLTILIFWRWESWRGGRVHTSTVPKGTSSLVTYPHYNCSASHTGWPRDRSFEPLTRRNY